MRDDETIIEVEKFLKYMKEGEEQAKSKNQPVNYLWT